MAMTQCKECKNKVSSKAKVCPSCGVKDPGTKASDVLIGLLVLIGITWGGIAIFSGSDEVTAAADRPSIPFEVLERKEQGNTKMSIDVQVQLIDGHLPTAEQIGEVSEYLVRHEQPHKRSFVSFYLPDMKPGAGAFATAHHNPKMQVKILDFMLMQYPQYQGLIDK